MANFPLFVAPLAAGTLLRCLMLSGGWPLGVLVNNAGILALYCTGRRQRYATGCAANGRGFSKIGWTRRRKPVAVRNKVIISPYSSTTRQNNQLLPFGHETHYKGNSPPPRGSALRFSTWQPFSTSLRVSRIMYHDYTLPFLPLIALHH